MKLIATLAAFAGFIAGLTVNRPAEQVLVQPIHIDLPSRCPSGDEQLRDLVSFAAARGYVCHPHPASPGVTQ